MMEDKYKDTIVIGISATALFDMREIDQKFVDTLKAGRKEEATRQYREETMQSENDPLGEGTAYSLIETVLGVNRHKKETEKMPLVEVIILSKNSPETGRRILNEIERRGLPITRFAFTGGVSVTDFLPAFSVDLFLTMSEEEAQKVTNSKNCAAAVLNPPPEKDEVKLSQSDHFGPILEEVRISFDGDGVLFSEESEKIYQIGGLEAFQKNEVILRDALLPKGPFARLLFKLMRIQKRITESVEWSSIRISLVTARNAPSHTRVLNTFRAWGVYIDQAFFLGGVDKAGILKVLNHTSFLMTKKFI